MGYNSLQNVSIELLFIKKKSQLTKIFNFNGFGWKYSYKTTWNFKTIAYKDSKLTIIENKGKIYGVRSPRSYSYR